MRLARFWLVLVMRVRLLLRLRPLLPRPFRLPLPLRPKKLHLLPLRRLRLQNRQLHLLAPVASI